MKNKVSYNPLGAGFFLKAVPSTEAQREIWASLIMDDNATLCYNESLAIEFTGDLKANLLNLAFQKILKKHDSLRAVFSADGKTLFIKDFIEAPLTFLDFSDKSSVDLEFLKKGEVEKKYDLINGPCYRATLVKTGNGSFTFLLSAHHIICDGWSFAFLLTELSSFYEMLVTNKKDDNEKAYQFADFAIAEYRNGINREHRMYWLKEFELPLDGNSFPVDFKRPAFRTFNSSRFDAVVPMETVKKIKKLGASSGSSFYSTLMSIFNILLYRLTQSHDVVVGMASASQPALEKDDLVGYLVNLLPLRTTIKENIPFNLFMKSVRSKMLDAFDHQFYSYGSLVKDLNNLKRDPATIPLFNVVFNIDQQAPDQGLKFPGIKTSYKTTPRDFENFEIFINAVSCGDKLTLECQYNTNLFTKGTLENWIASYIELMNTVASDPLIGIKNLEIPGLVKPAPNLLSLRAQSDSKEIIRDLKTEEKVKAIWSEVLLNDSLTVEDNFFSVGGHSLLAIEVATLLQQEFNKPVSIRDIFENPTIISLANKISAPDAEEFNKLPVIEVSGTTNAFVSNNQLQIWFTEEMHPGTLTYILPSTLRLKTKINLQILEKTIHLLIERHPAFRTIITVENGVPVQKILDKELPQFKPRIELVKTTEDEILSILSAEAKTPFNKEVAPMYKVKLFELGENDYVIFSLIHHSIWDGWSFDIYFEELNIIYSALVRGETPKFVKNPVISYVDYSLWLEKLIGSKQLDKQISYWENKLKGPLPILELPEDFKRPKLMSHKGAAFRFSIPPTLVNSLGEFAKKNQSSQFNVILTAFKITLARYTNMEDIIVGLPVRGRNTPEVMQTIGYFVNTVALRSQIDLNLSFEENLSIVSRTCIEALDNQLVPFQVILNKINYQRDPARTPIFQSFFSYQDVSHRSRKIDGTPYTHMYIDKKSTHTDLDLWIRASAEKIDGGFEYNTDIFSAVTIERFTECFIKLLEGLNENIQRPLNSMSIIPEKQQELILKSWNDSKKDSTEYLPFYKIFEENVRKNPGAVSIETGQEKISYQELNRHSTRIANALVEKGVGRGDLVGISLTRNVKMVAAILGVLKTGAGYVPLDPGFPQDRLDYMISSSTPKVLITEEDLVGRFKNIDNKMIINKIVDEPRFDYETPAVDHSLNDIIYVIYTSGSTGSPKGVQVTHGAVTNFLLAMKEKVGFSGADKILAVTTLSFDIAVLEIFLPLVAGGTVFLASSSEAMDGAQLKNILEQKNITFMQATPSTWRLLLASKWNGDQKLKALCGGEAFPIDLARKLLPICQSVFNMYGPTETTVWSTCKELKLDDEIITVGRPIANTSVYVLDDNRFMKPIGATGELFIAGLGVAKGYYGRPDLTAERFVENPFNPEEKMYATGDLARFTHNGEIECLGRNDGQVKVRGYRIELGEIEAEMQKISGVFEVAAITSEYRPGDVRIIAYYSTKNGARFDERALREDLSKMLPSYMIPSHFTYLSDIPKTLNGKIDKKSLPRLQARQTDAASKDDISSVSIVDSATKISQTKEVLRLMWLNVLGVPAIKDIDNFFDLGGNSLLAVSLFSKISSKYNLNIPLAALIEAQNFDEFVNNVEARLNKRTQATQLPVSVPVVYKSLVAIKSSGDKKPLFCFHGVGGNILNYINLAPATKNERPLLGIQSVGLDGFTPPLKSIEEMARNYIKEIKLAQPEGPYLLAGGSMGGMIALEAAIQLGSAGEKVEKLIMFDTFGPNLDLKSSYQETGRGYLDRFKDMIKIKFKYLPKMFQASIYRKMGFPIPLPILLTEIEWKNYQAIWSYYPKERFSGDLHLVRARKKDGGWYGDPVMGWRGIIAGEIKTYEIDGTHENFIESPELVSVLKELI